MVIPISAGFEVKTNNKMNHLSVKVGLHNILYRRQMKCMTKCKKCLFLEFLLSIEIISCLKSVFINTSHGYE